MICFSCDTFWKRSTVISGQELETIELVKNQQTRTPQFLHHFSLLFTISLLYRIYILSIISTPYICYLHGYMQRELNLSIYLLRMHATRFTLELFFFFFFFFFCFFGIEAICVFEKREEIFFPPPFLLEKTEKRNKALAAGQFIIMYD